MNPQLMAYTLRTSSTCGRRSETVAFRRLTPEEFEKWGHAPLQERTLVELGCIAEPNGETYGMCLGADKIIKPE